MNIKTFIITITVLPLIAAVWLTSNYSANHTNQFRADNQFFINDFRNLEQNRAVRYYPIGRVGQYLRSTPDGPKWTDGQIAVNSEGQYEDLWKMESSYVVR